MSKARFSSLEEYWDSVADPQAKAWLAEHLQMVLSEEVKEYFLERLSVCDRVTVANYRKVKQLLQASFIPEGGFYKVDFLQVAYLLQGFESYGVCTSVLSALTDPLRKDCVAFPFTTDSAQSTEYARVVEAFYLVFILLHSSFKPVGVLADGVVLEKDREVERLNLISTITVSFSFGVGFSAVGFKDRSLGLSEQKYRMQANENRFNVLREVDLLTPLEITVENGYFISTYRAIFREAKILSQEQRESVFPEPIRDSLCPNQSAIEMGEAMQNLREHKVQNTFEALRKRAVYVKLRKLGLRKLQ